MHISTSLIYIKPIFSSQGVLKVRKRVTKMVLTVSVIYGFCWLPNLTAYALAYLSPSQQYGSVLYITSIVLVTCNSTVNPFIYVFVNQKFREKIKSLLCCGKTCGNKVGPSSSSSSQHTANTANNGYPPNSGRRYWSPRN